MAAIFKTKHKQSGVTGLIFILGMLTDQWRTKINYVGIVSTHGSIDAMVPCIICKWYTITSSF